jgi:hypothetical protein
VEYRAAIPQGECFCGEYLFTGNPEEAFSFYLCALCVLCGEYLFTGNTEERDVKVKIQDATLPVIHEAVYHRILLEFGE